MAGPAGAAPVASFVYSPAQPLTGETVTFTSTSTEATTIGWDLDAGGLCDDASGPVAARSFPAAGSYDIRICVNGLAATQTQSVVVRNRPPFASFSVSPSAPVAREQVTLTSSATDPDGPIASQTWDLDGDGAFDDATGESALYFWGRAGTYPVWLRVVDRDGAAAVAKALIVVAKRPVEVFRTAPLVRIVGQPTATGARLDLVTVSSPKGAHVGVRCRGRGCPYKHKRFTSKGKRVNLRKLAGNYRAGAVIEVRVTKFNTIGKFTRIRIRAGRNPARVDCRLQPGKPNKPTGCQS